MKYKHKNTGNIATSTYSGSNYKVSIPQNFTIPKWIIENSNEWEKIEEISVGTKVVDTYPDTKGVTYEKLSTGKWKHTWIDNYTISEDSIGEGKRFQIVKEEVKKDYEILQIKNKFDGNIITFNSKGNPIHRTDGCHLQCTLDLKSCLNTKSINIFQVRRLSDSEIFTIGDKVDFTVSKNQIITEFRLLGNHISVYSNSSQEGLPSISKVKTPLFTTLDEKEIFEGDKYYFVVVSELDILDPYVVKTHIADWSNNKTIPLGNKQFSTEEKAQEFIVLNKPILSITEVLNFLEGNPKLGNPAKWAYNTTTSFVVDKLKDLVKSKL